MSQTVIDALVVTLGLDASGFDKGKADSGKAVDDLGKKVVDGTKKIDGAEDSLAKKREKRSRDEQGAVNKTVEGYKKIRNELASIAVVFTAGVGVKNFITDTINGAANLSYLSENLRLSTSQLTSWQRASERAGGSAEGIISQLKESADTLAQLRTGQGPSEALQNFFRWGGKESDLKDGNTYLLARSRIIADIFKQDPSKAANIAKSIGIGEDQFNFLKQGPAAVLELVEAQKKNAVITEDDAKKAQELRNQMLDLRDSLQATATKILISLAPAFKDLSTALTRIADAIGSNREAIGQWAKDLSSINWDDHSKGIVKFTDDVRNLADTLKDAKRTWDDWSGKGAVQTPGVTNLPGALRYGSPEAMAADRAKRGEKSMNPGRPENPTLARINDVLDEGIHRTLASFGVQSSKEWIRDHTGKDDYLAGPKGSSAAPKVSASDADLVRLRLQQSGWTKEQSAGITASFIQESALKPDARNPKSGAYGIGQWLGSRVKDFKDFIGRDLVGSTLDDQLRFFQHEVTDGKEKAAGNALRSAKTAEQAARIHSTEYERPGQAEANNDRRQRLAAQLAAPDRANNARAVASGTANATAAGAASSRQGSMGNSTTTTTTVHVDNVNVTTQATDAKGIAAAIRPALEYSYATQANTGISR